MSSKNSTETASFMDEYKTVNVPTQFADMVEIDQFLATINEHAILTVTNSTGHLIYVNDAFCQISQWDRSELIGQHYSLYSAGYHSKSFYDELWATIKAGKVWRGRVKNRAKDGSYFWIDSIVKPVLKPDGEISHIISIRSDITELVETQEALEVKRQNESAVRRILAIALSGVGIERMLNGALEVLSLVPWLSGSRQSAVFLTTTEPGEIALAAEHNLEADNASMGHQCLGECICSHVLETRSLQLAACAHQHDNADNADTVRHIAVPLVGQADAFGVLVFSLRGNGKDIARNKTFFADMSKALSVGIEQIRTQDGLKAEREQVTRKQQQLEENSALMEAGFDNMVEGLVALTPDLTILAANKRFAELMEISPELTRQGKSFDPVLEFLRREVAEHSNGTAISVDGMREIVRTGTGKPVKFKFRSGKTIEARANPIPEVGAVLTIADITEALVTEGRIRQGHKLEALGDLAGGVAHEYNNLLTSIQGFARMALKKLTDEDRVRESLQEIIEASGRATEITQQMLTFSKKQVAMPVVANVGETIADMEPVLRVFVQSNLDIRFDIRSEGYASVDPALLNTCLGNLVKNSRQAMPDGGTITIVCDTAEFDETFVTSHGDKLAPGRYVSITVTDTGRGMDPKVLAHIFDPFFTTREVGAGTGLGLSMAFGMAKNQNGAVDVESAPGNGATFTIYLPQVPAPSDQTADGATTEATDATVVTDATEAADGTTAADAEPPAPSPDRPPPATGPNVVPTREDAENLMRFL